jgi:hypothetical protein
MRRMGKLTEAEEFHIREAEAALEIARRCRTLKRFRSARFWMDVYRLKLDDADRARIEDRRARND